MKRSDFYSMSLLLEEKLTCVEHATMPNIMNRNKTISMAALLNNLYLFPPNFFVEPFYNLQDALWSFYLYVYS